MGCSMYRKFWTSTAVVAAVATGAGAAGAADLAAKAPVYKAPPAIVSDWAGFYIGVNGGYGWNDSLISRVNDNNVPLGNFPVSPKGGFVGGQAGYNWQNGSVVAGLEVDFDGADIKATDPTNIVTLKTGELASARARLGYAVLPNLLFYGTGGAGLAHTTIATVNAPTVAASQFGWVAGAGLEYKIWGNFIARVEYLHYDFDEASTTHGYNFVERIDTVRGGLSYKF
jgi:outer membrane immunogenic protein